VSESVSGILELSPREAFATQLLEPLTGRSRNPGGEQVIVSDDITRGSGKVRGLWHAATLP
jgi:hypothetical protein